MAAPEELKTLFVKSLNARFTEKLLEVRLFCVYYFCIIIFLFKFEILNIFEFEKLNFIKYYYIGSIFKSLGLFMTPLGWGWAGFVWGYALLWFLLNDPLLIYGKEFIKEKTFVGFS